MNNKIIINNDNNILNKFKLSPKINKDWKETLNNDYISSFKLDGYTWNSVSHYYNANKYKISNFQYYTQFTVESNSKLSKDIKYIDEKRSIDFNFYNYEGVNKYPNNVRVMIKALFSKFSQNKVLKEILLSTGNDSLFEEVGEGNYVRLTQLELVRNQLKNVVLNYIDVDLSSK